MKVNLSIKLICADCGKVSTFTGRTVRSLTENARAEGWAISRNNSLQWCPKCAVNHRLGKAMSN